jgi:formylglycine-generating enzyme required for sulfatase activity
VYQLFEPRHVSRFPGYLEYTLVIGEEDKRPHPQCPVTHVTWFDSWCACTWLHSRLPSEYEWEYACRAAPAAKPQMFWFGEEAAATAQHLWCSTTRTEPRVDVVGGAFPRRRQPNPWTLYDVHGNVWEWTASWFFDHAESGRVDGSRAGSRVLRGGSFGSIPDNCRATIRGRRLPSGINNDLGFRAARAGSPR